MSMQSEFHPWEIGSQFLPSFHTYCHVEKRDIQSPKSFPTILQLPQSVELLQHREWSISTLNTIADLVNFLWLHVTK